MPQPYALPTTTERYVPWGCSRGPPQPPEPSEPSKRLHPVRETDNPTHMLTAQAMRIDHLSATSSRFGSELSTSLASAALPAPGYRRPCQLPRHPQPHRTMLDVDAAVADV